MSDDVRHLEIFAVSDGGYSWAEVHIFRHPRHADRFAVDHDSGCSCRSYEYPPFEVLEGYPPVTRAEARDQLITFFRDNPYVFTAGQALDLVEKFHTATQ
jgi:hypothetical protein